MTDDLKRLSDLAHSGEELIEGLLRARDDAEIDAHIERAQHWGEELIALGEAIDPIRLYFDIVRPTSEETARIRPLYSELRDDQRGHCNYVEAALGHLNAYLRQPDTRSKSKGGNRRRGDYGPILAEARTIKKTKNLKSNAAAVREAAEKFPMLVPGDGDNENVIKYIARKL